jgi:hypothetical protein
MGLLDTYFVYCPNYDSNMIKWYQVLVMASNCIIGRGIKSYKQPNWEYKKCFFIIIWVDPFDMCFLGKGKSAICVDDNFDFMNVYISNYGSLTTRLRGIFNWRVLILTLCIHHNRLHRIVSIADPCLDLAVR